ncbi:CU044_2847 family protein [Streptomyces sp. 8K308]|uniref:CU044_2847 family protein n=1 Tax=Streptomyces sp. 8K308 TaxID=2530388 RepID=UPI001FB771CB|nr:CU044_2847 family protein [Streptomyces sp. 8K308]
MVELPVGEQGPERIAVQVRELDEGLIRVGRPGQRVAARATRSLDAMLDSVRPVAERFVARFRGLADPPDEITVEFGVSLSADADVVIASASGEANFAVSLTWRRPDGQE